MKMLSSQIPVGIEGHSMFFSDQYRNVLQKEIHKHIKRNTHIPRNTIIHLGGEIIIFFYPNKVY